jgi:hypothetical protein
MKSPAETVNLAHAVLDPDKAYILQEPKRGLQGVPSALVGLTSACSVRRLSY